MSKFSKALQYVFNLSFVLAFFVHAAIIAYSITFPSNPSIKVYKKDLKDIAFPIALKLCVEERTDFHKRYRDLGYDSVYKFFRGMSVYERIWLGWSGHGSNGDGTTLGSVNGNLIICSYLFSLGESYVSCFFIHCNKPFLSIFTYIFIALERA